MRMRMLCHWWSIVPSIIKQMTTQTKSAACRFFIQVIRLMVSVLLTSVLLLIMTCLHVKKHWLFMSTWQPGQVAFISIPVMWTINGVMTVNGNEASAGVEIASYVIKCEHAHLEYITRPITPQPSPMLSNLVSYFTWALYSSTCLYDFYVHVITIPPNA